jgi:D-sedoheptulose 7-phosphate isomerase
MQDLGGFAGDYFSRLQETLRKLDLSAVSAIVSVLRAKHEQGKQIFIAGNGGSSATAAHMVCDLNKTVLGESANGMQRFRAICLSDNTPWLTAIGNDMHYGAIFSEPIKNLAKADDLLLVISASGNSANILEAIRTARGMGLITVGLLGCDGGEAKDLLDHCVLVPSDDYGIIEDVHMVIDHLITSYFREMLSRE